MPPRRPVPPPPTRYGHAPLQRKTAALRPAVPPPPTRFGPVKVPGAAPARGAQAKMASLPPPPARVVQKMKMDLEDDVGFPDMPPPNMALWYYQQGAEWHSNQGDFDAADAYFEMVEKLSGKSVGQSSGSHDGDEFEESYFDVPFGARPTAPASLWKIVYSGLVKHPTNKGQFRIKCEELCGKLVILGSDMKEIGKGKRPPMCHIIAFNHIKWGIEWLHQNKNLSDYLGPNVQGVDMGTYRDLVWDPDNLQPGHTLCNSQTAHLAVGNPEKKHEQRKR